MLKVSAKQLQSSLRFLKPGLDKKVGSPQSDCYIFLEDRIMTISPTVAMAIPFESPEVFAVKHDDFSKYVFKLTDDIEIGVANASVRVQSISSLSDKRSTEADFPIDYTILTDIHAYDLSGVTWKHLPDDFITGLQYCSKTIAKDDERRYLSCVHIMDNHIYASNVYFATGYTCTGIGDLDASFDIDTIKTLIAFSPTEYAIISHFIVFTNETNQGYLYIRNFDSTKAYPNGFKYQPMTPSVKFHVNDAFLKSLDRVSIPYSGNDKIAMETVFNIKSNNIDMDTKVNGRGDIRESLRTRASFEKDVSIVSFQGSAPHLLEVCKGYDIVEVDADIYTKPEILLENQGVLLKFRTSDGKAECYHKTKLVDEERK